MREHLIGKTLGQYQIVSELGHGGMAAVYKAYQPSLQRYVAIKVLPAHLSADQDLARRFEHEALTSSPFTT
jgi:serine/threonine protein kinase